MTIDVGETPPLDLLTITEVTALLRVSRAWVYRRAASGELPSVRLGADGPVRFSRRELELWLADARASWTPGRG